MLLGQAPVTSVKLVMLGNSGVGKSSLICRWVTGSNLMSPKSTIGATNHLQRLTIDESEVDLFVWDTAGQEQFAALAPLYVRQASVAVLTADITDKSSFDSLGTWAQTVSGSNEECPPMVLAVNKVDLQDKCLTEKEIREQYKSLFKEIYFVSAVTGQGIEELYTAAATEGLQYVRNTTNDQKVVNVVPNDGAKKKSSCC